MLAATYHQVWWPDAARQVLRRRRAARVGRGQAGGYVDPATGEVLPTWDEASTPSALRTEPWHVARFGDRFDAQGVLAGSPDAARCIGYLTKYLTKQVGDCHQARPTRSMHHAARLAEALRYQPCSPRCANWLRYGIQPKNARPGLAPGRVQGQGSRRRSPRLRRAPGPGLPQVVRQDPGRPPRRPQGMAAVGLSVFRQPTRPGTPGNPSRRPTRIIMDHARRLLHVVADRLRWQASTDEARRTGRDATRRRCFRRQGRRRDESQTVPVSQWSRLLYRVSEAALALGLSRAKVYELINSGALRAVRIDGARRIRAADLEAFVASLGEDAA